jgi:hypothetical protein
MEKEHDQRIHNYNRGKYNRNKYVCDRGRKQAYYFGDMNEETDAPYIPSWWGQQEREKPPPPLPKVYIRDKDGKRRRIR